jgi:HEAT repeat protein
MTGLAAFLAAASLAACGAARTGEPWSTKARSAPQTGPLPVSAHDLARSELLREAALGTLMSASEAGYDLLRANAIEAMQFAPDHAEPLVRRGLADPNRGVRFVAVMTVGEEKMTGLVPLVEPLLQDPSKSVRAGAMYALKRCARDVDLSPLAEMIRSDDPEVRANAALVLGELGNPSACSMIRQAFGTGMGRVGAARAKAVDLQLAEALVKLGDEQEMDVIRAALFAPPDEGEITALACMMCGRLRDERTVPNLVRLARRTGEYQHPAEVRMAATWALARLGSAEASVEVPMGYVASADYPLRMQAALTLGEIGHPSSLPALTGLLRDVNPLVQVAAAGAILQIEGPPVAASSATGQTVDTNDGGG